MRVNEIFYSIDGEGLRAGALAVFIRLAGCNLRCSYCDTSYAWEEDAGQDMTIREIRGNSVCRVCLIGSIHRKRCVRDYRWLFICTVHTE